MIYALIFLGLLQIGWFRQIGHLASELRWMKERFELHLNVHEEMAREYQSIHNVVPFRREPKKLS